MLKFLKSKGIPLMFGLCIIVSCMYNYDEDRIAVLAAFAAVIEIAIYAFYDFLAEKNAILRYMSIIGSFLVICAVMLYAVSKGDTDDALDFMIWFLSPQSVIEYNALYTIAFFIGLSVFISSTVYYFTQVRYRIIVSYMLMMIPFAIYAKEIMPMPLWLMLLLLVSYFAVMVHCRQTVVNYKTVKVKYVNDKGYKKKKYVQSPENQNQKTILNILYKKSVAYFLAALTILALIVPKPNIEANRDFFESILQASELSRYILSQLGGFSDDATSAAFLNSSTPTTIFEVYASEEVNLRGVSYSRYEDAGWHTEDIDKDMYGNWNRDAENLNPEKFFAAINSVCKANAEFAEKYQIEDFINYKNDISSQRNLEIEQINFKARFLLNPLGTYNATIKSIGDDALRTNTGMLIKEKNTAKKYSIHYFSENKVLENSHIKEFLDRMNKDIWGEFLNELYELVKDNDEYSDVVSEYIDDYNAAQEYKEKYTYTELSERVIELAQELTDKYESDYDKALAIENHFLNGRFLYSTEYIQPRGKDYEYFLFDEKTGACFDYATSMVMLSQAVGLPARFVQGFMMDEHEGEKNDENSSVLYNITTSDAHAFPEVYISGYGWMDFEPTKGNITNKVANKYNYILMVFIALITAAMVFCVIFGNYVIAPVIAEKLFRIRLEKSSPNVCIQMIVKRVKKLIKLEESVTAGDIVQIIRMRYQIDFYGLSESFDAIVYGGEECSEAEKKNAIESYLSFHERYIEELKEEYKKKNREKIKARRAN